MGLREGLEHALQFERPNRLKGFTQSQQLLGSQLCPRHHISGQGTQRGGLIRLEMGADKGELRLIQRIQAVRQCRQRIQADFGRAGAVDGNIFQGGDEVGRRLLGPM